MRKKQQTSKSTGFIPVYISIILAVVFIAYCNSFHGQFQFDDGEYVVENPIIKQGLNIVQLFQNLNTPDIQSRVITFWTFALNHKLGGLNVFGYHLVNWLIHLANAWLVFWLCELLWKTPALHKHRFFNDHQILSLFAALIFAAHPLQTQAVTYISQRFASLATCFYLLAVCFFLVAKQSKDRCWIFYWLTGLFALTGMFTKQIVFTLPVVLLMVYVFFYQNEEKQIGNRLGLISLTLGGLLIIPALFKFDFQHFWLRTLASHSHPGDMVNAGNYFLTQFHVLLVYLRLLLFPIGQNLDYDFSVATSVFNGPVLLGMVVVVLFIASAVYFYRRDKLISFGIGWFLITLTVESSIIPIRHVIFEHRMYLPSIGFAITLSLAIFYFLNDRRLFTTVMGCYIALLCILTYQRNTVWATEIAMWQDVITKSPKKARGYLNLGKTYYEIQDYPHALKYLNDAGSLDSNDPKIYNNLGLTYKAMGDFEAALINYSQALTIDPAYAKAYNNRGLIYKAQKKYELALADYNQALTYMPGYAAAISNRGVVYGLLNNHEKAVIDFTDAMRYNPDYFQLYQNRGFSRLMLKQYDGSIADLTKSIELNPGYGMSYVNRAQAYFLRNDFERAYRDVLQAERLGQKIDPKIKRLIEAKRQL